MNTSMTRSYSQMTFASPIFQNRPCNDGHLSQATFHIFCQHVDPNLVTCQILPSQSKPGQANDGFIGCDTISWAAQ